MTQPTPGTLRDQYAAALTAAAHQCDGTCGLPEQDCYDAHPITWSAMAGGTTHVDGSVLAIADTILAVRDQEMDQLRAEVARLAAGQCTHYKGTHDQHHTQPVTGCPWCATRGTKPENDHA